MKKLIICLSIFWWVNCTFAQLNEFMIQTYFMEKNRITNNNTAPWLSPNMNHQNFFNDLKNIYKFNTIYFGSTLCWGYATDQERHYYYNMAKNAGLKTTLDNPIISTITSYNEPHAKDVLNDYSSSDYSVIGYNIVDEPLINPQNPTQDLDSIPQYSRLIKGFDKTLLRYANLYPNQPGIFSTDNIYREKYIQRYVNDSDPNLLSYDIYPIYNDINYFFISLYDYAIKSVENSIPFIYVLTPYKQYADFKKTTLTELKAFSAKTKPQFNYVINAALVYGAKGIAYWPGFQWVRSENYYIFDINYDNGVLAHLSNLHQKLIDNSDILLSLNFISAYHKSNTRTIGTGGTEQIHQHSMWSSFVQDKYAQYVFSNLTKPVYKISDNSVPENIVISFMRNKESVIYFWLFNKSLTENLSLRINSNYDVFNCFDNNLLSGNNKNVSLDPGEAKLFKVISTYITDVITIEYPWCNFWSGFNKLETATHISFYNNTNSITNFFEEGAIKSFVAENISIKQLHAKRGSIVRFKAYKNSNEIPIISNHAPQKPDFNENIEENAEKNMNVFIYPNPASNIINVKITDLNNEKCSIEIYNAQGILLEKINNITQNNTVVDISNYPQGFYFVNVQQNDKQTMLKVVKK